MKFSFFDWHCDTAGEMLSQEQPLGSNRLAVSLERAKAFENYVQVMAHWTSHRLSDEEGWARLCRMHENLLQDPAVLRGEARICTSCPPREQSASLLLAVEDIRPLNNKTERVEELYRMGFRILTPMWYGETCIGGAHNTAAGLTSFGKEALTEALSLGFLLDISHASEQSAEEILLLAEAQNRPVIASHSNAHRICPVSRNLRDEQIKALIHSGGVIGINLYTEFLSDNHPATREDVLRHVEYFLEQGAEKALCFGCDMDGAKLPSDLPDLSAIPSLGEFLLRYYSENVVRNIFYENAYHFAERTLTSAKNP